VAEALKGLLGRPRQIVVTKTRDISRVVITDLAGRITEKWRVGGHEYQKAQGGTIWQRIEKSIKTDSYGDARDFENAVDFKDLDWITDGNYSGTLQVGGAQCFAFVPGGVNPKDLNDPKKLKADLEAEQQVGYVDADSRLPIMTTFYGTYEVYKYNPALPAMLTLPADLAARIKSMEDAQVSVALRAPRPY
jgi:hypothetical protein